MHPPKVGVPAFSWWDCRLVLADALAGLLRPQIAEDRRTRARARATKCTTPEIERVDHCAASSEREHRFERLAPREAFTSSTSPGPSSPATHRACPFLRPRTSAPRSAPPHVPPPPWRGKLRPHRDEDVAGRRRDQPAGGLRCSVLLECSPSWAMRPEERDPPATACIERQHRRRARKRSRARVVTVVDDQSRRSGR